MKEEVMKILKMVEEGKLNAEQAARLLDAMGEVLTTPKTGKFIRININSADGNSINVVVPIGLMKLISGFIPKNAKAILDEYEVDLNQLITAIQEGANGTLVDITSEDGDVIKITVE